MPTTIAVKNETLDLLKMVREETKSDTYDETIKKIIMQTKKPKKSLFGKYKNLKEFKREEIDRFS